MVSTEQLQKLEASPSLRILLQNPHLRALLEAIDGAPDSEQALKSAMEIPIFVEFVDKTLEKVWS